MATRRVLGGAARKLAEDSRYTKLISPPVTPAHGSVDTIADPGIGSMSVDLWIGGDVVRGGMYAVAFGQSRSDQVDKLDEAIAFAETALQDARLDELDVGGALQFAEFVVTNPSRLWVEGALDQRQRFQKVLFPRGVTYCPDGRFEPPKRQRFSGCYRRCRTKKKKKRPQQFRVGTRSCKRCVS